MTPRAFSFNSPHGACPDCQGLGAMIDFDPQRIVPDESKSLADGAIAPWARGDRKLVREALQALSARLRHRPDVPFAQAAAEGARGAAVRRSGTSQKFEGLVPNLRRRYEEGSWAEQEELEAVPVAAAVPTCRGQRLKLQSLSVRVKGRTIADYVEPADLRSARRCSTACS